MLPTASRLFDFLQQQKGFVIDRREIASPAFGTLRRSIRFIVTQFLDTEDPEAIDISERLRSKLSEWLTVPVEFSVDIPAALTEILGEPKAIGNRWGEDTKAALDTALQAAGELAREQNLMRETLALEMLELRERKLAFRIYCHKRARSHFESILTSLSEPGPGDQGYLHSVAEYGKAGLFDVLIKVGPLRTLGWGKVPAALVTAPRFDRLLQLVWTGCADEEAFGYDPAVTSAEAAPVVSPSGSTSLEWHKLVTHMRPIGYDPVAEKYEADADELKIFQSQGYPRDRRRAIFLQFDATKGILYAPHSRIVSFDSTDLSPEAVGWRVVGESFQEGMFLIQRYGPTADFGDTQRSAGRYDMVWKAALIEQYLKAPSQLRTLLRTHKLDLQCLHACMYNWCLPTTSVIHAPKKPEHFKILVSVLGLEAKHGADWWKHAWDEIRQSRGEAIQSGLQEHELMEEQEQLILSGLLSEIRERAATGDTFRLRIPEGRDLSGSFEFTRVTSIEHGFLVPETELRTIHNAATVEQWRA